MKCIFCKEPSENSRSLEHIIPESLGNIEHVLRPGVVCDSCNNYFATKVEKEMLEKPYFKNIRHRNVIPNKKGRLVKDKALIFHPKGGWVDMWLDEKGFIFQNEDSKLTNLIATGECTKLILSVIDQPNPNDLIVSRFLAKAALESLAYKFLAEPDWVDELVNEAGLDPLREYARYGKGPFWKYSQRRIYGEEDRFIDPVHHPEPYEILHEMDFLYLDQKKLYYTLVIMGVEFVINLDESEVSGYYNWTLSNEGCSPIRRFSEVMLPRSVKA
jgi:hypothetical protein